MSAWFRRARALVVLGAALAFCAVPAAASAKERQFFARDVSFTVFGPTGEALPPGTAPAPGDSFVIENRVFEGTRARHRANAIGRARLACMVVTVNQVQCNGFIALPRGTLLATNVTVPNFFSNAALIVGITGGTGQFEGASGYVRVVQASRDSENLTVFLTSANQSLTALLRSANRQ
jgi:hypothetical protein